MSIRYRLRNVDNIDNLDDYEKEKLAQITELHFNAMDSMTLSETIGTLPKLEKLTINCYKIKELPDFICNLTHLKKLYITNTSPYMGSLETLPDCIDKLTELTHITVNGQRLNSLPESIDKLINLTHLVVKENMLETLPDSIGGLKNLHVLDIRANEIKTLPDSIGNLTNLKKIYIKHNRLKKLPYYIKPTIFDIDVSKIKHDRLPEKDKSKIRTIFSSTKVNDDVMNDIFEYLGGKTRKKRKSKKSKTRKVEITD